MQEVPGYRIEGVAGQGGWSVVYRAVQLSLERPVALKVIAPELARDEDFRARFRRECEIAASLDHPHVIPVYDAGEAGGSLYVAMRWVDGADLRALAPLEPGRAARLVAQVAGALDAAHARGLVHRDVKPGNVLVEQRPDGEHAYLTDFGLTKEISSDPGLTEAGRWLGTVDFAAPEQIRGRPPDARSDVYSLGCVLGFAVTGLVPFPRPSPRATMQAHLHEWPPPLPFPLAPLNPVVARALAKHPTQRFATAGELGQAALAAAQWMTGATAPAAPKGTSDATVARVVAAGAALMVLLVAIVIALAIGGGGDGEPADSVTETRPIGEIRLLPVGGGAASGVATVHASKLDTTIDINARLPRLEKGRVYEAWLYNDSTDVYSLGWEKPDRKGGFYLSDVLPDDYRDYQYVDVSIERENSNGFHSERSVMRGPISELDTK